MPTTHEKITRYGATQIDYSDLIARYPWLVEPKQNCILSPDSDGLLCGLFMSHYLRWKIKGFYDGKVLVIEKGYSAKDCVFLDMEIFRKQVRSIGQHMLLYNRNRVPENWQNFENCFAPNNIRGYDTLHDFALKYPFGTIHLLIPIVHTRHKISIPKSAITPLLFTDGTWMNLLQYTENSLSWISFLRATSEDNPLHAVFLNDHYSLHTLMVAMDDFLRRRDAISIPRERGDRIAITLRGGEGLPHNLVFDAKICHLKEDAKKRGESFITLLSGLTQWDYRAQDWSWGNWQFYKFAKGDFVGSSKKLNGLAFDSLMKQNPLSFAVTSTQNIEYTIEEPDHLP